MVPWTSSEDSENWIYFMVEINRVYHLGWETERSRGFWPEQLEEQGSCQVTCGWNRCG